MPDQAIKFSRQFAARRCRELVAGCLITLGVFCSPEVNAAIIYDSIPSPDPTGAPSLGYQATQTDEFGDHVVFGAGPRQLTSVRIGLVSWAQESDPDNSGLTRTPTGWMQQLTLNLYAVGNGTTPGSLLATHTDTFLIPWAPSPSSHPFVAVNFDFSTQSIMLPDEIIYGLAFNTQTHGANPTGLTGPYNSLNFAVATAPPTIGTDADPDAVYWDTSTAGWYADNGAAGVDIFRQDTGWAPYVPMAEFHATPEPASLAIWALGGIGCVVGAVRRRRKSSAKSAA